jgi:Protein of unknown function (DUF565)
MQNTRLSNFLGFVAINVRLWLANPWRRFSLWLICLLFGNFLGSVITLMAGQAAQFDIWAAALLLAGTEAIAWLTYRRRGGFWQLGASPSTMPSDLGNWTLDLLNALRIGVIYSMFVEAFKLGS